jgi:cytochrome c oxidase subunit II
MKQIPASLLTLIAGILITIISLWVGQNHHLLPEQASEQAPLVDGFFNVMVTIATALFLVVQGAILFFTIQFRQRKGDNTDGVPIEGNVSLEILWTAIPAIIVVGLGVYSVDVYDRMGGFNSVGHNMMAHHHSVPVQVAQMPGSEVSPLLPEVLPDASETQLAQASPYGIGATEAEAGKTADLVVKVLGANWRCDSDLAAGSFASCGLLTESQT